MLDRQEGPPAVTKRSRREASEGRGCGISDNTDEGQGGLRGRRSGEELN